jgi:uncharacterized protein (DUF4415 family)
MLARNPTRFLMTNGDAARASVGRRFALPQRGGFCYKVGMARRPSDPRTAAEKAFKAITTPKPAAAVPAKPTALPGAKETVSLPIDRDVLDFFQADGPGWQERINAALRKTAGLEP